VSIQRKVFECTRCGHAGLVYVDPPRCRKCGFQTGVIRLVAEEEAKRLLEQQNRPSDSSAT
jgi:hypothetical protein